MCSNNILIHFQCMYPITASNLKIIHVQLVSFQTLSKVIVTVMKFTEEQTSAILRREESKVSVSMKS